MYNGRKICGVLALVIFVMFLIVRFVFLKANIEFGNAISKNIKAINSNSAALSSIKNIKAYNSDIYSIVSYCDGIGNSEKKSISQTDLQLKCDNYSAKLNDYESKIEDMKLDSRLNNYRDLETNKIDIAKNIVSTSSSAYFGNDASKQLLSQYEQQYNTAESNATAECNRLETLLN